MWAALPLQDDDRQDAAGRGVVVDAVGDLRFKAMSVIKGMLLLSPL